MRRIAPRLIPGLNAALTVKDIYDWWQSYGGKIQQSFQLTTDYRTEGGIELCGSGGALPWPSSHACPPAVPNVLYNNETVGQWDGPTDLGLGPGYYQALGDYVNGDLPAGAPGLSRYTVSTVIFRPLGSAPPRPTGTKVPYTLPVELPGGLNVPEALPVAHPPYILPPGAPVAPPFTTPTRVPYRAIPYRRAFDNWNTDSGYEVYPDFEVDTHYNPFIRPGSGLDPFGNPVRNPARKVDYFRRLGLRAMRRGSSTGARGLRARARAYRAWMRSLTVPSWLPKPPRNRTKEKKLFVKNASMAGKIFGGATEFCDAVEALFDATGSSKQRVKDGMLKKLPKGAQRDQKRPTQNWTKAGCPQQAAYVYKNFDKIDWDKAIDNLIMNEIQDRVIGKSNKVANTAYLHANPRASHGIGLGPVL